MSIFGFLFENQQKIKENKKIQKFWAPHCLIFGSLSLRANTARSMLVSEPSSQYSAQHLIVLTSLSLSLFFIFFLFLVSVLVIGLTLVVLILVLPFYEQ